MAEQKTILPTGYKPVGDKTKFTGKLNNLSPSQKEIRNLMVADERLRKEEDIQYRSKPPLPKLKSLSDSISNNIQAQTDLRSITPYIKRAEQIWCTLLMKPNGLEQELLSYDTVDSHIKNSKLHSELLQSIKTYFTTVYPFEETLPDIIRDVMFRTGSYVLMNLSHSALDHLINGMSVEGTESLKNEILSIEILIKNKHFVGGDFNKARNTGWISKTPNNNTSGFESIFKDHNKGEEYNLVHPDLGWTFTDNPIVLKVAELRNKIVEDRLRANSGNESIDNLINVSFTKKKNKKHKVNKNNVGITDQRTFQDVMERIYPNRNWKQKETLFVRRGLYYTGNGKGVGITYHVPSEACIPVHLNGEKNKPIGYILLVEPKTGEFLKSTGDIKFYSSNKNRAARNDNPSKLGTMNNIVTNIKQVAQGKDCEIDMDWAIDMVNGLLEKEIIEGFLNGDRAAPVSVTLTEANKKIYLSRAFRQQGVRAVFVPAESITYFAIDFNDFGVGKSLVEEAKMIITRLAILDIADTVANLENAVSKTLLTIDLEEENFAPTELINQVRENYLLNNPSMLNFVGFSNIPIDRIIDGVKESLVRIKVNAGDNRNTINPNIEESQDNHEGLKPVDNDSRDKALNSLASYFDLKRSWLEDSEQGNDFAIEAFADQELLMNICIERSIMFSKFISEHFVKHINTNEVLLTELINIIKDNKKLYDNPDHGGDIFKNVYDGLNKDVTVDDGNDDKNETKKIGLVLKDFINNLDIRLPLPASMEQYNKLVDKLEAADKLVNGWKEIGISDKLLKRTLTDMGLEQGENAGDENSGTNTEYVMSIIEGVLRRDAYRKLGISIPFDEIVADGKQGGLMTFINQALNQRENVVSFIEALFKGLSKTDPRVKKIGEKYAEGFGPKLVEEEPTDDFSNNENFEEEANGEISKEDEFENEDIRNSDDTNENEDEEKDNSDAEAAEDNLNEGLELGDNITFE